MKVIWNTLIVMATVFAVFLGISIYGDRVQRSRIREMLTPESRKAALPNAEAEARYETEHGYSDIHSDAQERRYRLSKAVEEDEAKAAANARIAEDARREAAKQQAAAQARAAAPRLRAEAEEAKRRAAARAIEEKYAPRSR